MINFSVIIPNYNHATFLKQRIDSILDQAYSNFEIIILDDYSTDNSRNIIETYRGHKKISHIIYNKKNSGSPFKQWKKGVELAKFDWIWIAESDDYSAASFLHEAALTIEKFPSTGVFYYDSYILDEADESSLKKFSEQKNKIFHTKKWNNSYFNAGINEINEYLKFDCTINNMSAVIFSKKLFFNINEVLENFIYYGDWAFLLKAVSLSDIYYCNKPMNYYRKHCQSHLNNKTSIVISRHEYFKILRLLYYSKSIIGKKELLDHFSYNYLSFGIVKDGIRKGWQILKYYLQTDRHLAFKVILRLTIIFLFRIKRPFYLHEKEN